MEIFNKVMSFLMSPEGVALIVALFAASEYLASTEKYKANSVLQAVKNGLGWLKDRVSPKQIPPQA
jgi:hypothetical protein